MRYSQIEFIQYRRYELIKLNFSLPFIFHRIFCIFVEFMLHKMNFYLQNFFQVDFHVADSIGLFHLLSVQGCGRRIPRGFTFKSAGSFQGGKDATTLKFPRGRKGLYLCIAKIFQGG